MIMIYILGSTIAFNCKITFFSLVFLLDFIPTVRSAAAQRKSSSKTGVIVGVVVGVAVFGLVALAAIFLWMQKRRKLSLEQQGTWYTRLNGSLTEQKGS